MCRSNWMEKKLSCSYGHHEGQYHKDKPEPNFHLWEGGIICFPLKREKQGSKRERSSKACELLEALSNLKKKTHTKKTRVFLTYHKLNLDVICDIFKAFEAHHNLVLGVVQVAQMQYNDLIAILWGETKRKKQNNTCSITICTTS